CAPLDHDGQAESGRKENQMNRRRAWAAAVAASVVCIASACGSSSHATSSATTAPTGGASSSSPSSGSSSAGNTAGAPGVPASSINIGFITSVTGVASSTFADSALGAEARFDALNAAGGIDGRKVNLIVADDQSSAAGDLAASQDLVSKGVF